MSDKQQKKSFWVEDKWATNCYACNARFTWFLRRHHCRACGQIFCKYCVSDTMGDPWGYKQTKVLICAKCLNRHKQQMRESSYVTEQSPAMMHRMRPSNARTSVAASSVAGGSRASSLAPTVLGEPMPSHPSGPPSTIAAPTTGRPGGAGGVVASGGLRSGLTTAEPSIAPTTPRVAQLDSSLRSAGALGGATTSGGGAGAADWRLEHIGEDVQSLGTMTPRARSPHPLSPEPRGQHTPGVDRGATPPATPPSVRGGGGDGHRTHHQKELLGSATKKQASHNKSTRELQRQHPGINNNPSFFRAESEYDNCDEFGSYLGASGNSNLYGASGNAGGGSGFYELNDNDFFTFGAGDLCLMKPLPTPALDWATGIQKKAKERLSRHPTTVAPKPQPRIYMPKPSLALKMVPSASSPEILGIPTFFRGADSMELHLQTKARLEMMELHCSNHLTNFVHCAMVEFELEPQENLTKEYLERVANYIRRVGSGALNNSMITSGQPSGGGAADAQSNSGFGQWTTSAPGSPKAGGTTATGEILVAAEADDENLSQREQDLTVEGHARRSTLTPEAALKPDPGDDDTGNSVSEEVPDLIVAVEEGRQVSPPATAGDEFDPLSSASNRQTPSASHLSVNRANNASFFAGTQGGTSGPQNPQSSAVDWCALLCEITWKVISSTMVDMHNIITDHVNLISCIPGGSYGDHEIIDGVMFFRNVMYRQMNSKIVQPRILLLSGEVDRDRLAGGRVTDDILEYVSTYAGWLDKLYERIRVWAPTIVVVEQGINHYLVELMQKENITLITHGDRRTMDQLAHACGGKVVNLASVSISEMQDQSKSPIGICDLFEVRDIGDRIVSVFSGFEYRAFTSVVLRGGDDFLLQKLSKILNRALICAHHLALQAHYLSDFKAVLAHGTTYDPEDDNEAKVIDESYNVGVFRSQREINLRVKDAWRPNSIQINSIPLGKLGGLEPEGLDDDMPQTPTGALMNTPTSQACMISGRESAFSTGPLGQTSGFISAEQRRSMLIPKQVGQGLKVAPPPTGGAVTGAVLTGFSTWRKRSEYLYYTDNDASLWEYLCERAGEGNSVRILVHGEFKLTVTTTVETVPARPMEDRQHSCAVKCRRCYEDGGGLVDNTSFSPLTSGSLWLPVSYHTLQLSFGAFLEMSFYCGAGCVGDCGHELHDMQRGFAFYPDGDTHAIVTFEVDDLETYYVKGPTISYPTESLVIEQASVGKDSKEPPATRNPDILAMESEKQGIFSTVENVSNLLPSLAKRGEALIQAAQEAKTHPQLTEVRCELRGFLARASEEVPNPKSNVKAKFEINESRGANAGYVEKINRFVELDDPASIIYTALQATSIKVREDILLSSMNPAGPSAPTSIHHRRSTSISMSPAASFFPRGANASPAADSAFDETFPGANVMTPTSPQPPLGSTNHKRTTSAALPLPSLEEKSALPSNGNQPTNGSSLSASAGTPQASTSLIQSPNVAGKPPLPTSPLKTPPEPHHSRSVSGSATPPPSSFTQKPPASGQSNPSTPRPCGTPVTPRSEAKSSATSTPTTPPLEGSKKTSGSRRSSIAKKISSALNRSPKPSPSNTPPAEDLPDPNEQSQTEEEDDLLERIFGAAETDTKEFSGMEEAMNFLKTNSATGLNTTDGKKTWQAEFDLPDGLRKSVKVGILFPDHFAALRYLYTKGHPDRILSSLQRGELFAPGGGKSSAKFFTTQDKRFILKEMQRAELLHFVAQFGKSYFEHIVRLWDTAGASHAIKTALSERGLAPSLLCKIFGVFEITVKTGRKFMTTGEPTAAYIVMENLFCNTKIDRMYDLKGSQRNRETSDSEFVQLDENFVRQANLGNLLYCRERTKSWLEASMSEDTALFARQNIMDYSLIVGINEENKQLTVGIIDYFRPYTLTKIGENLLKRTFDKVAAFGDTSAMVKEPTVTQPSSYRDRFLRWMRTYFCSVPCHEHQWGSGGKDQVLMTTTTTFSSSTPTNSSALQNNNSSLTSPTSNKKPTSKKQSGSNNASMASSATNSSPKPSQTVFVGANPSLTHLYW